MGKHINWSKVAILIIGIALLLVVYSFLLAWLIKFGIEAGGSAAAGAKTTVSKLRLTYFPGRLNIYNLEVANKANPWKNVVQIGAIKAGLNTEQLLYKRIVIDEIAVEDLQLGTTRNVWGGLPQPKKVEKKASSVDLGKMAASLNVDPSRAVKAVTAVGPLEAKENTAKITADNDKKLAEANAKVSAYKPEEELKAIDAKQFENISAIKTIPELQDKLKKLEEAQKQLKAVQDNYDATKAIAEKNMQSVQDNLKSLADMKNRDMAKIFAKLDIGNYDLMAIGRSALGPKVNGWIDTGLNGLAMVQTYMPPKKPKPPKKQRFKGLDIAFANKRTMPKFLIKRIALSGLTAQGTTNEISYSGAITDITSQPVVWGKPLAVNIKGAFTKRKDSHILVQAMIDHTKDVAADSFKFEVSGYSMRGVELWDEATIPLRIKDGLGVVSGTLMMRDDQLDGRFTFSGRKMTFTKLVTDNASLAGVVADAIASAPAITAEIVVGGTYEQPEIRLVTNLDAIISARVNKVVGEKLDAVKKQITAEYDKQVGAATAQAEAAVKAQTAALDKQLEAQKAVIDKATKDLEAKQKEIESQIETQKNAATKAATDAANKQTKQAEDALKKALPKF